MTEVRIPSAVISSGLLWRERVALGVSVLVLALVMIRAPVPIELDAGIAYRTLLYENLRLGYTWGEHFITTDGPLGALQAPGYLKGSIWMAMVWQILGNFLLASLLVSSAFKLQWRARWWALALLGCLLSRVPMLAPWLAMVLLGHDLIRNRTRPPSFIIVPAAALGFLALSSLGYVLLGALYLLTMLTTRRAPKAKIVMMLSFGGAFIAGWLALGQSLTGLALWFARTLPGLGNTSEFLRIINTKPLVPWAGFATATFVVIFIRRFNRPSGRQVSLSSAFFLFGAAWLAWKALVLRAFGLTEAFFATMVLIGFILIEEDTAPCCAKILVALAIGGLIRSDPLIFTDAIGQLNRQIVVNVKMLSHLSELRPTLLSEVKAHHTPQALTRIKATVGNATVGVIGGSPAEAILGGLNVDPLPVPLSDLLSSAKLNELNRTMLTGSRAPAFVLQNLQAHGDLVPGLEDAPAQLALYQNYDIQFEESGLMLWRKKITSPEIQSRVLVASGELAFGDPLHLPATDAAYWIELDIRSSLLGSLWTWIGENSEPGLLLGDAAGTQLRYPLLPAVSGAGFLIEPFVRGEVDFIRRESGTSMPRTTEITVLPPASGRWPWKNHFAYRLYALSGPALSSSILPDTAAQTYRLLNRMPLGVASKIPFATLPTEQKEFILFAHPPSRLEFAVTGKDHRVRGHLGMLPGAYQGIHPTDGVDFSIEFIGRDGVRQVLYHRWLDPVANRRDQGRQDFTVNLPASGSGRLFLRTYNPPGRGESYDWAFWSYVVIE